MKEYRSSLNKCYKIHINLLTLQSERRVRGEPKKLNYVPLFGSRILKIFNWSTIILIHSLNNFCIRLIYFQSFPNSLLTVSFQKQKNLLLSYNWPFKYVFQKSKIFMKRSSNQKHWKKVKLKYLIPHAEISYNIFILFIYWFLREYIHDIY